ncbi:heavy-metal-associated domain-containing protein [Thiorhodococcus fuscus]|uniref:Heavy-metal-associated domain-containing protein n=1 Tax=Thiorhodococcus fuscus TaxID=527200 RepID=A0ABW4Y6G7_9GAMM
MVEIKITGMHCPNCIRSATQAIQSVAGVDSVEVDLETGSARVVGSVDSAALIAAIQEVGFSAEQV